MSTENVSALKSIRYVVMSALNRLGQYSDKEVDRFMVAATEYFSEYLNLFHIDSIEVAYLKTNGTSQLQLPPDFVSHTKVGVDINGEIWVLGLNEHLVKPRAEACGDLLPLTGGPGGSSFPSGGYLFADHYRDGSFIAGMFGRGGGWNMAYYNIDKGSRMLLIDGSVPRGEIILEYIGSGVKKDGTTLVPLECVDSMRQFVILQAMKFDKKWNGNDVRMQERTLEKAEMLMERFITTPTMEEILDLFYESYRAGIKR